MDTQLLQALEPAAKTLAATAVSQTLNFCMERKYLEKICDENYTTSSMVLTAQIDTQKLAPRWIQFTQIGKPLQDDAPENCFIAIQKILHSCFMPNDTELIFIVSNDGKSNLMYLGIRPLNNSVRIGKTIKSLNEFIKGIWPGVKSQVLDKDNEKISELSSQISSYENVYALTGIPSMESQYKSIYPATMDQLMAGMNNSDGFTYMVVAHPLETSEIDSMLFQVREMDGRAESLKSFNFSEGFQQGKSRSIAESLSETITDTTSESVSKRKGGTAMKVGGALLGVGVGLAASALFPPAASTIPALAQMVGALGGGDILTGLGGTVMGMTPTETKGFSHSVSKGGTNTTTDTMSENQSRTVSQNIVNKHIEAAAELLFYHSKRFESGKALGMWKVGVFIAANSDSDIRNGSTQLKSILSGQESVFEPIRMHDISSIMEDRIAHGSNLTIKDSSLAQFAAPTLYVDLPNRQRFEHPLGIHYKELQTVLTTKELSYLVNFPLRSVPGISVVDSTPEFNLNTSSEDKNSAIGFGKLIYGGAETQLEFFLPKEILSRHTLISGINGSGKTNTVEAILNSIGKLPFLVIEPAKTEYVDWAIEYNKANPSNPIDIYIPGCNRYRGKFEPKKLKLNPFDIVWLNKDQEPNVLSHIDRLKSTFAAAFPMYDILPVLMEDLIYSIYQNKSTDWLTQEPVFGKTMPPTLNSMSMAVEKVIGGRGYEPRVEQNMKACLNTRIDSLKRGWKGQMLNTMNVNT